jgi:trk system potassium uptake protein TrkA
MGVSKTIAEVENIEYIKLAEGMGVDAVINKKLSTAGRIFRFTLSNKVRSIKCLNGSDAEVLEFIVNPSSAITKGPLKDLNFPKEAIIGGVIRGNEVFIATENTIIKPYDRVAVFALPQVLSKVNKFFI